ncbi:hypothetical protein LM604_07740, partial [Candidatus Acetothermia bacterium]|nr:hypothetical protein [Candidatus Acetothermia bacterium]
LRELGVKVPKEFAVLPPMVLDRLSTDWVLGPGNHLLTHYRANGTLFDSAPCTFYNGAHIF